MSTASRRYHSLLVTEFGGEPIGARTDFCTDFLDLAAVKPFALLRIFFDPPNTRTELAQFQIHFFVAAV
jgi:hypothetical protein